MCLKYKIIVLVGILFTTGTLVSCVDVKKAVYFNGVNNEVVKIPANASDPKIQNNDLLSISISSLNSEASALFNAQNIPTTLSSVGTTNFPVGYLVNSEGNIEMPFIGNVKASGLSKLELRDKIYALIM